jgi:hypothetical protein
MDALLPWTDIFDAEGVDYVTHGSSVSRDHIAIHCPWCGDSDPSHHLGISLKDAAWGCWRNPDHRGRRPHRLLYKILGDRAAQYLPKPPDTLPGLPGVGSRFQIDAEPIPELESCRETWERFARIQPGDSAYRYAESRGLSPEQIVGADLRLTCSGFYRWRLLIPLRWNGVVVGWTGRAIGNATPRYLTSENTDTCAEFLMVSDPVGTLAVEGPLDALAVAQALQQIPEIRLSVIATLGIALSARKRAQLQHVPNLILGWDADAWPQTVATALELRASYLPPPPGYKDWAEPTCQENIRWIQQHVTSSSSTAPIGALPRRLNTAGASRIGMPTTGANGAPSGP